MNLCNPTNIPHFLFLCFIHYRYRSFCLHCVHEGTHQWLSVGLCRDHVRGWPEREGVVIRRIWRAQCVACDQKRNQKRAKGPGVRTATSRREVVVRCDVVWCSVRACVRVPWLREAGTVFFTLACAPLLAFTASCIRLAPCSPVPQRITFNTRPSTSSFTSVHLLRYPPFIIFIFK
jgi:hypothetical protein